MVYVFGSVGIFFGLDIVMYYSDGFFFKEEFVFVVVGSGGSR